ncbi:Cht9p [Halocaridina rubra]|uniref:Cht9p n=1 Tax=Halocaridina rubra TaxID=373956 RepID=A0AAN8X354_HALRR
MIGTSLARHSSFIITFLPLSKVLDPWNELCPSDPGGSNCAFDRFVALKEINPQLTVLLAVGGWNEGSEDYSVMAADPAKRQTFITSSIELMQKHGFEGLDVDWEYPGSRGGMPEDKDNFITLITELKEAFSAQNPPLMLTGAVPAGRPTIDAGYDIPRMAEILDQVHIMSYDYFGPWANYTGHNAPMCGHWMYEDDDDLKYFNVMYTLEYYLQNGVPPEKLVLGIATYGRCFTLDDINDHGLFAPAHKPGPPGPYIQLPGTLGLNEICERVISMDCTIVSDDPCLLEPYVYCRDDNIWCGFDDAVSAHTKARFARNMGISGILIWQIDTDDFHPICYEEPFKIVNEAKRGFATADGIFPECACLDSPLETTTVPSQQSSTSPEPTDPPTTTPQQTDPPSSSPVPTDPPTTTPQPTDPPTSSPVPTDPSTTTPEPTDPPTTTPQPTDPSATTQAPTEPSSITSTSGGSGSTISQRPPRPKPDCSQFPEGSVFPHEDCNKYWVCANGQAILELCAPGTLFDPTLNICNWEDNVDTSDCVMWTCEVDNTYLPHADCDKYYWCYQGSPHEQQCPDGLFWNQNLHICDDPTHVNTENCNIP